MSLSLPDFFTIAHPGSSQTGTILVRQFKEGKAAGRAGKGKKAVCDAAGESLPIIGHGLRPQLLSDITGLENIEYIDSELFSRVVTPTLSSFDLESLCVSFDIPNRGDAALCTGKIFLHLLELASRIDVSTARRISNLLLLSGDRHLSRLFRSLDHVPAQQGQNVRPTGRKKEQGVNPETGRGSRAREAGVLREEVSDILGERGTLSSVLDGFEVRTEQLDMAGAVMDTVNGSGTLLAEAGTGTGKSFAYLVSSILRAVRCGERVVVSTNTKNLQDQLYQKDLPVLEKAFPVPFTFCQLKGRQNYLCRARLDELVGQMDLPLPDPAARALIPVYSWSKNTETGDIAENGAFDPQKESAIWKKINCDVRYCPSREEQRGCFLTRARQIAQESDVTVINHALLLSDIIMDRAILGEYDNLVIDEAHNLEKVAYELLGRSSAYPMFYQFFERQFSNSEKGGSFLETARKLRKSGTAIERRQVKELLDAVRSCRSKLSRFFGSLSDFISSKQKSYSPKLRFLPGDDLSRQLSNRAEDGIGDLETVRSLMGRILLECVEHLGENKVETQSEAILKKMSGSIEELTELTDTLEFITGTPACDWVYWIQADGLGASEFLALRACPIEIAPLLKEKIYDSTRSVILSSATMSIGGDFSFSSKILGTDLLDPGNVTTFSGGTSFSLESQALLLLPTFVPSVTSEHFVETLPDMLASVVGKVPGGTLILFTSRDWLRRVHLKLKPLLESEGVSCLAQGYDGSREVLLEKFRSAGRSVLLGTDSFWEGIDVPGDALQLVVIVRLPFPVPSEPVTEAISGCMTARGENPFTDYSLPRACIKLKQGFGRLIRSCEDRGAVLILDRRIVEKRYGSALRRALPVEPLVVKHRDDMITILGRWFEYTGDDYKLAADKDKRNRQTIGYP